MEQQESAWITAIGTAIGLTGAAATAAGAAIIGGGAATLASGVQRLVNEQYPWDNPGKWIAADLKAGAIGGATAGVTAGAGAALGPMLGAGAESAGLATNVGTTAAEVGAPQGAVSLSGQIPKLGVDIASQGANIAEGTLGSSLSNVASNASGILPNIGKQTISGAISGALGNLDDPGRGALIGGAGGLASAGVSGLANVGFRGSGAAFVNNAEPSSFSLAGSSGDFVRTGGGYNPGAGLSLAGGSQGSSPYASFGLQAEPTMQPWQQGVSKMGGNLAGKAARMGMSEATAPDLTMRNPDPYAATPYGTGSNYWRRLM